MTPTLDRRIYIDRPTEEQDAVYGSRLPGWELLRPAWAQRRDERPSRAETLRQGLEQGRQRVFYTLRWCDDLDSSMRIRDGSETFQVIGGPAEVDGRRQWIEIACERYETTGGAEAAA